MAREGTAATEQTERARPRLDFRLLGPALIGWAASAATLALPVSSRLGVALALALVALATVCRLWRRREGVWVGVLALTLVTSAALVGASGLQGARDEQGPLLEAAARHGWVRGEVTVTEQPRLVQGKGDSTLVFLRGTVTSLSVNAQAPVTVSSPVTLIANEQWADVQWRDSSAFAGTLAPASSPGDIAQVRIRGAPQLATRAGWLRVTDGLRAGLRHAMAGKPADAAGLLPALVVGDTSSSSDELVDAMRTTGLAHLAAVSGTNCVMVLLAAMTVARWVRLPRRGQALLAGLALLWFVVLARPEPSVLRAATMGTVGLIAMVSVRPGAASAALGASITVLLVADPSLARNYGFALSVVATFGLITLAPTWTRRWKKRWPRPLAWLAPIIAVPLAAQVMTAPILILLQPSIATLTVPANILAEPAVAPATLTGVVIALLAPVCPPLAGALGWVAALPAGWIALVAHWAASLPAATIGWISGGLGALALFALLVTAVLTGPRLSFVVRSHPARSAACALWVFCLILPWRVIGGPPAGWAMVACDVGQGDGLLLRTGADSAIAVDAGPDPASLISCLQRWQIDRLDALVISHFHADHAGGAMRVLDQIQVGQVLAPPISAEEQWSRQVVAAAQRKGVPVRTLWAGDRASVGPARLVVWWPAWKINDGSIPNNNSLVLSVQIGSLNALLLGDIEREAGSALRSMEARDPTMAEQVNQAQVVKIAHHGSDNLDAQFLAQIKAPIALISVGEGNDYGHPRPGLLAQLQGEGRSVWRTDQSGDLAVLVNPDGLRVEPQR